MLLLRSAGKRPGVTFPDAFPYNVPVIRALDTLEFTRPVTILVGDNGSGKSTLLEAIAAAARLPAAGSDPLERDPSLAAARELGDALKLVWSKRTGRGLFLRAEDFFGFARRMARLRQEMEQDLSNLDGEYADRSDYARGLASQPYQREIHGMRHDYGDGLDAQSHGEASWCSSRRASCPMVSTCWTNRKRRSRRCASWRCWPCLRTWWPRRAQFILATHSPILMACPDAAILSFDGGAIRPAAYADLEQVRLMRDFLNNPDQFLRHL
jgi:predicted ATPase